jgi:predicted alpha/beta-hydrolase family hydrolase
MTRPVDVETPRGRARVHLDGRGGAAVLVLGHGAGGGPDAPDLAALAASLPADGLDVVRVEQPWRVSGRRIAPAPAVLDDAWLAVIAGSVLRHVVAGRPVIVGGRSAGARVACRTATAGGAAACLAVAFPLHPPGRPDRSRAGELLGAGVETLVVQGERDPFGIPDDVRAATAGAPAWDGEVVAVPGGHQPDPDAVVAAVRGWWASALRLTPGG